MGITLKLFTAYPANAWLGNYTGLLKKTWKRSNRRRGGNFIGTAELTGARWWLDEWFEFGLLREIREYSGGEETWRGSVVGMEYDRAGETYSIDFRPVANVIKMLYTSIGDNVLTNGSGESGTWNAVPIGIDGIGGLATVTQDNTWSSHGNYSIKVVSHGGIDGAYFGGTSGYDIPIVAGKQYVIRATLKVTSGSWRVSTNRSTDDGSLAHYSTGGALGDHVVQIEIPDTNTFAGNVDLRITCEATGAGSTVNVDACVFQLGPHSADTGWYLNRASISAYGRKEDVLLEGGMSVAAAQAKVQSDLLRRAFAASSPQSTIALKAPTTGADKIKLTFAGDWYRLFWRYTTLHGTHTMSEWIALLAGQEPTITLGRVMANATDYYVDDAAPLRLGECLKDICGAGDVGGALYRMGVYAPRTLSYELVQEALSYHKRAGKLFDLSGTVMDPARARPGWVQLDDMPMGATSPTEHPQHDPRWRYIEEVTMNPPDNEHTDNWPELGFEEGSDIQ